MAGFIHASDWHLSRLTWQHRPRLVGDSFYALEQIVDLCLERRAVLLAAGDLLDKDRPDSAAVSCMHHQMDRMEAAGLPVYYVQGQHEKADPPWMASHSWPIHLDKKTCKIPGVAGIFYGLDWRPRDQFAEAIAEMPDLSQLQEPVVRLVCHQVWAEHMGSVVTMPEADMQQVAGKVIQVLTGDYHVHQLTSHNTQYGMRSLVSPGSISIRNLGEAPEKKVWYYNNTDGMRSIPLRGRPFVRRSITDLSQLDAIQAEVAHQSVGLPADIQTPIVVLQYPSDLPGAFQRINEVFGDCHLWLEEQRSEVAPQDIELQNASESLTLPDLIAANVPAGEIQDHLLQLMRPELSPKEAVRNLVLQLSPVAKG